jgi:hypothetical protein
MVNGGESGHLANDVCYEYSFSETTFCQSNSNTWLGSCRYKVSEGLRRRKPPAQNDGRRLVTGESYISDVTGLKR